MITLILIEDSKVGGYTGFLKELPQVIVEGETPEEVKQNLANTMHDIITSADVETHKL